MPTRDDLPISEYAFPGPLRDLLVAAILAGEKTTTTSLLREYEAEDELLPQPGDRAVVIDSAGHSIGIETIEEVRIARLGDVDLAHAIGEGEGYANVAEWRAGHEGFWHSDDFRAAMNDPDFHVDDETLAVLVRFSFEAG
jgi:uncharacterized protein YhfF